MKEESSTPVAPERKEATGQMALSELARKICHAVEQRSDDCDMEMHARVLSVLQNSSAMDARRLDFILTETVRHGGALKLTMPCSGGWELVRDRAAIDALQDAREDNERSRTLDAATEIQKDAERLNKLEAMCFTNREGERQINFDFKGTLREALDGTPTANPEPPDQSTLQGPMELLFESRTALEGLLKHTGIADQHAEDIDAEDHRAESVARSVVRKIIGFQDARAASAAVEQG